MQTLPSFIDCDVTKFYAMAADVNAHDDPVVSGPSSDFVIFLLYLSIFSVQKRFQELKRVVHPAQCHLLALNVNKAENTAQPLTEVLHRY